MQPVPGERPVNTSKEQDINQILQVTSDYNKELQQRNITNQAQDIRKNENQVHTIKQELHTADTYKAMADELLKSETLLQQEEEKYDLLVAVIKAFLQDYDCRQIPTPTFPFLRERTKRSPPDESQELGDRNIRRHTEKAKNGVLLHVFISASDHHISASPAASTAPMEMALGSGRLWSVGSCSYTYREFPWLYSRLCWESAVSK